MNEFDFIEKFFRPLTNGDMLQDDAAILKIPAGHELVVSSDTLNEGTHFLKSELPANIAHKALRVNLSDLAAMGATPLSYQLNLAFPAKPSEVWLAEFARALLADQTEFKIFCSGGDTTSILGDYLSISITALGIVPTGKAIRRNGAKEGDTIMLTGPVGDAFLGLQSLRKNLDYPHAIERYRRPKPCLQSAELLDFIHAAADISDGLIADLTNIGTASNLAAEIFLNQFEFSTEIKDAIVKGLLTHAEAITGGDDYELVLAVAPEFQKHILSVFPKAFPIGKFKEGQGVQVFDKSGQLLCLSSSGWSHF